jgi:hypothetical protein
LQGACCMIILLVITRGEKNYVCPSGQLRADRMPGSALEGQLMSIPLQGCANRLKRTGNIRMWMAVINVLLSGRQPKEGTHFCRQPESSWPLQMGP